jgi:chaperonin cofactor prefoldin
MITKQRIEMLWEDAKFEINYFFNDLRHKWTDFKNGVINLWKYKKLIWNDRWWDSVFLHNMIKFKIKDMRDNWQFSISCNSKELEAELYRLVKILDKIEKLEDDVSGDFENWKIRDKEIDNLYKKFGNILFSTRTFYNKDCEGNIESEYESCLFRQLWD